MDESTGLENRSTGNCTVGSNPTLSATPIFCSTSAELRKLSKGYINAQHRRLIRFFNWLVDCGPNDCNPMSSIGAPKLEEKTVLVITEGRMRNKPDSEIFQRNVGWIHEADIIVAEATMPSLGVGCELGSGESVGKPVICLYKERDCRRRLLGTPGFGFGFGLIRMWTKLLNW